MNSNSVKNTAAASLMVTTQMRSFKKTVDSSDARRSRFETTTQLRKTKKDAQMAKRRKNRAPSVTVDMNNTATASASNKVAVPVSTTTTTSAFVPVNHIGTCEIDTSSSTNKVIQETREMLQLRANNSESVTDAELKKQILTVRRLLSRNIGAPFTEAVQAGMIHYFVQYATEFCHSMDDDCHVGIVMESLWGLTNIASSEYTTQVADSGIVPLLARLLLEHKSPDVREQAGWCLGNIAGHSTEYRDAVLHTKGMVEGVVKNLQSPATVTLLNNFCWVASNLVRGKPAPPWKLRVGQHLTVVMIDILNKVMAGHQHPAYTPNCVTDILWALSYISDGDSECVQQVLDCGILPTLVRALEFHKENDEVVPVPLIRTLGNITTGSHEQTQLLVDSGVLRHLRPLLLHRNKVIRKETAWMCSNIAAGTPGQCNRLMDPRFTGCDMFSIMTEMAHNGETYEIRKEALFWLSEVIKTNEDTGGHFRAIVNNDGIEALVEAGMQARNPDLRCLRAILEAVHILFNWGVKNGEDDMYKDYFESVGGIDSLELLQEHSDAKVYDWCVKIIDDHFSDGDDECDENLIVPVNAEGTFGFGIQSTGLPSKQLFPEDKHSQHNSSSKNLQTSPPNFVPFDFSGVGRSTNV